MEKFSVLLFALLLGGCATTDPGKGAGFSYRLPRTDVAVTLTLELKDCNPFTTAATLKLASAPGAQPAEYLIAGEDLASSRIKRGIKIGVDGNRVLTSVNSSVSDRTPAIIGNYVAAATKLMPFISTEMSMKPTCSKNASALVDRRTAIETQIAQLRADLNTSAGTNTTPSDEDRQRMKDVESLTKELAGMVPLLTADLAGKITIEPDKVAAPDATPAPQALAFNDFSAITPWLAGQPPDIIISGLFTLNWTAQRPSPVAKIPLRPARDARKLRACGMSMSIADPQMVHIAVEGAGRIIRKEVTASIQVPAAQLAGPLPLCLDAGFGETRSLELAFDSFGQVTSYNWNSEARGEAISAMVAGNAGNVVSLIDTLEGPSRMDRQKAEIEQLEAEQKLAKLRACKAILDAGGTC